MKKNTVLLIIFLSLVGLNVWLLTAPDKPAGTKEIVNTDKRFTVEDTVSINRISLKRPDGVTVTLNRNGNGWNIGEKKADPNMTRFLLSLLKDIRVKHPLSEEVAGKLRGSLSQTGIAVSIFSKDKKLQSFIATGEAQQKRSYFFESQDGKAYQIHIPGYDDSYVSGIFEIPAIDWRNRRLWDMPKGDLDIRVKHNEKSFGVTVRQGQLNYEGEGEPDQDKLKSLVSGLVFMEADRFVPEKEYGNYSNLRTIEPFYKATTTDQDGTRALAVYDVGDRDFWPALVDDKSFILLSKKRLEKFMKLP
ncbi:hypothetical protein FUAX_12730 [Fulvitalea axinellae]|uniref:DUF4340 domain-containing protein n=1 Tax=Fulvitalea axinellae TaxID=1182444 RepID=A0AAU9C9M0_9BACT|nr:hypothetical protein FUAX_12730 [Fulvitalea axinellae]